MSICCAQLPVGVVRAGQHATLAVHPVRSPRSAAAGSSAPPLIKQGARPAAARCHSAHALSNRAVAAGAGAAEQLASGLREGRGWLAGGQVAERCPLAGLDDKNSGGYGPRAAGRSGLPGARAAEAQAECDREASGEGRMNRAERSPSAAGEGGGVVQLRQKPRTHPNEAYREARPPGGPRIPSANSDMPSLAGPPVGAAASSRVLVGSSEPVDAMCLGGAAAGVSNTQNPTADPAAAPPAPSSCGPRLPAGAGLVGYDQGLVEFSNTNGSGRGHPGDPPGPPPTPEGATACRGGGLHWAPEPARWEMRSHSAPPAAAACSPPNSRKAR